jgi:hypothetical protein
MRSKIFFYSLLILSLVIIITIGKEGVAIAASTDTESFVNISYKASFETLYDSSMETIYILIENTSQYPLILKDIKPMTPEYIISDNLDKSYVNYMIDPKKTIIIPIGIKALDAVKPGKDVLFYDIGLVVQADGKETSINKILSVDVSMGVTVSGNILTVLGVPSLIFIPGFIILVIISGFLKKHFAFLAGLDAKNPLFWVIIISIGLIVAFIYPNISGLWGMENHNLFSNYGLEDIVAIWISSVIFAIVVSAVLVFFLNLYKKNRVFCEKDDPFTVIKKVSRYQKGIKLSYIYMEVCGEEKQMFLLPKNGTDVMMCSAILVGINCVKTKSEKRRSGMNEKLKEIIYKDMDIKRLAGYLRWNRHKLAIEWKDAKSGKISKSQSGLTAIGENSLIEYK